MLDRVSAVLPALPPSEQRVGRLLLKDPATFANAPITDLADQCHTSTTSVMRFCRSLGYSGFVELKATLGGSVATGVPFVHPGIDWDDNTADVFIKVIDEALAALLRFRNDAHIGSVDRAVSLLLSTLENRGRLLIYGVGESAVVAKSAENKFSRLGFSAKAYGDRHSQVESASILVRCDCILAVSNSGRSEELLESVRIAREQKIAAVAITSSHSPLAELADIVIEANHSEGFERYSPTLSRLIHLAVIDVLASSVAVKRGPSVIDALSRVHANLRRTCAEQVGVFGRTAKKGPEAR